MPAKFPIDSLSKKEREIFDVIRSSLPEGRFLVGGFVRDVLLKRNRRKVDLDVVTPQAKKDAEILARRFCSMIITLDEKFHIYRVPLTPTQYIDIAQIQGHSLEEDLSRRDFTINAIAVDLRKLSIFDPLNGCADLNKRVLRLCGEDVLKSDPLRILRAFSFAAQLDFTWTKDLVKKIGESKHCLKEVKFERINQELLRLFSSEQTHRWFYYMYELGVLSILCPEVNTMKDVYQGPYHHLDVLMHSFETLRRMDELLKRLTHVSRIKKRKYLLSYLSDYIGAWPKCSLIKWVAFWHDIGKPISRRFKEEKVVFYGHDITGAKAIGQLMERLKFSRRQIKFCQILVKLHLRPGDLTKEGVSERAIYRFFRQAQGEDLAVMLLSWADAWATRGVLNPWKNFCEHRRRLIDMINLSIEIKTRSQIPKLIDGHDVMEILGIGPGPEVGRILDEIHELQALGRITTRDAALRYVREKVKLHYPDIPIERGS